ncbi:MAG: DUF6673 family protein [Clostridium perfringens]|uniref:DUF6673 family protein n=1 Tax=Clostridium perfringens TaxID=1502 RepID=UPI000DF0E95E|nr:DUF6673 family protein [Clostridium perfringens]MDU2659609.1 DUF6673 family protein [Clostridioides difficile]MDU3995163.1 DUF6673 family protein [Enterobacter sp.]EJT5928955.1 hypothetical protein [Clostridium perfringens]EJT6483689.1 hypothetical protein [Clostridium perfringens]ELC8387335.1 hypothetical protein [Clostridium perfringens]
MIKINGIEFDFDAFDAEDAEKAEKEMKKVHASLKNAPRNLDRSGVIKYTVKSVRECFDNIFGSGAADKIFKGKTNMKLAMRYFEELSVGIQEQDKEFDKEMDTTIQKYSPNRAARRNNKNKNRK